MPLEPPRSHLAKRDPSKKPTDSDAVRGFLQEEGNETEPQREAPRKPKKAPSERRALTPTSPRTFRLKIEQIDALKRHKDAFNTLRRLPTAPLTMDELGRVAIQHFLRSDNITQVIEELRPHAS